MASCQRTIAWWRKLASLGDIRVFMFPMQTRRRRALGQPPHQFTLWNPDLDELVAWAPKVVKKRWRRGRSWSIPGRPADAGSRGAVVIDWWRRRGSG